MRDIGAPTQRCATLQNVLDALDEMRQFGEIDDKLCREARSAVLSYSRAVGNVPARLKADVVELLDRLDEKTAIQAGLMPRRFSNLKSMLRRALNFAGNATLPARRNLPLSPAWSDLLCRSNDRGVQCRLRPFAGFCTDRNIEPSDVNEEVLEDYALEVRKIARSRNPDDVIKKVRRYWNKLVDESYDQLRFRAREWKTPRKWAMALELMPESFQKEVQIFIEARSPATFEKHFRCPALKGNGAKRQADTIMRIVTVMHENGHELSRIKTFSYIAQPQHFKDTIRGLKRRTGATKLSQLGSYVSTIHWLAETWVGLSFAKMRKLKRLIKVVGLRPKELAASTINVLSFFECPRRRSKAIAMGETVFKEFRAKGEAATRADAVNFRDALYWELGLTTGWRPATRARISLDENLRWGGRRNAPIATLVMPGENEKTRIALRVELPTSTSIRLRYFISHALPLLRTTGDEDNSFLFPGRFRGHITSSHLSRHSAKFLARRLLIPGLTGHKSRHVSAKLHLLQNPADWETVREHLCQRDVETTKAFYANVNQVAASRRVHAAMGIP